MARTLTTQDISWFLDLNDKGQLNLEPPYQRRSVWSPRDKRFFIDTILNNYPAPPIFLHKTLDGKGRPTYHVVDGKQRLMTIIEFVAGNVRIPDDFADVTLQKKRWKDLERPIRERFWNYVLIVEILPDVSEAGVRNIFERMNRNSRKLMPQELRHAKYDGWFITVAEAEADKQEWKDFGVVTAARMKRMADVQFISELLGILIQRKVEGFDQDALDDLYAGYEDILENATLVEDDFFAEMERAKDYIRGMIANKPEIIDYLKVQSHFFSLWCYIVLEKQKLLPAPEFATKYLSFQNIVSSPGIWHFIEAIPGMPSDEMANLEAARVYAENLRGASTDLTPRQKRHEALVKAIHSTVNPVNEND
jgi:hypothetical protein